MKNFIEIFIANLFVQEKYLLIFEKLFEIFIANLFDLFVSQNIYQILKNYFEIFIANLFVQENILLVFWKLFWIFYRKSIRSEKIIVGFWKILLKFLSQNSSRKNNCWFLFYRDIRLRKYLSDFENYFEIFIVKFVQEK